MRDGASGAIIDAAGRVDDGVHHPLLDHTDTLGRAVLQDVVACILAGQRHAGDHHGLVPTCILVVVGGAVDRDVHQIPSDHAGEVGAGQRGVDVAVIHLADRTDQRAADRLLVDDTGCRGGNDGVVVPAIAVVDDRTGHLEHAAVVGILAVERLGQAADRVAIDQTRHPLSEQLIAGDVGSRRAVIGLGVSDRRDVQVLLCNRCRAGGGGGQDVVARILARQSRTGDHHRLVGARIPVEEGQPAAVDGDVVLTDHIGGVTEDRTRGGRVAVIGLARHRDIGADHLLVDLARNRITEADDVVTPAIAVRDGRRVLVHLQQLGAGATIGEALHRVDLVATDQTEADNLARGARVAVIGLGVGHRLQRHRLGVDGAGADRHVRQDIVAGSGSAQRTAGELHLLVRAGIPVGEGERATRHGEIALVSRDHVADTGDPAFGRGGAVIVPGEDRDGRPDLALVDLALRRGGVDVVVSAIRTVVDGIAIDHAQRPGVAGILAVERLGRGEAVASRQADGLHLPRGVRRSIILALIGHCGQRQVGLVDGRRAVRNGRQRVVGGIAAGEHRIRHDYSLAAGSVLVLEAEAGGDVDVVVGHQIAQRLERARRIGRAVIVPAVGQQFGRHRPLGDLDRVGRSPDDVVAAFVAVIQRIAGDDHVAGTRTLGVQGLRGDERVTVDQSGRRNVAPHVGRAVIDATGTGGGERQRRPTDIDHAVRLAIAQDEVAMVVVRQTIAGERHALAGSGVAIDQLAGRAVGVQTHAIGGKELLRDGVAGRGREYQPVGAGEHLGPVVRLGARTRDGDVDLASRDLTHKPRSAGAGQFVVGSIFTGKRHPGDGHLDIVLPVLGCEVGVGCRNRDHVTPHHAGQIGAEQVSLGGAVIGLGHRTGERTVEQLPGDRPEHVGALDDGVVVTTIVVVDRAGCDQADVVVRILAGEGLLQVADGVGAKQAGVGNAVRPGRSNRAVIGPGVADRGQRQRRLVDGGAAVGGRCELIIARSLTRQRGARDDHRLVGAGILVEELQRAARDVDDIVAEHAIGDVRDGARRIDGAVVETVAHRDGCRHLLLGDHAPSRVEGNHVVVPPAKAVGDIGAGGVDRQRLVIASILVVEALRRDDHVAIDQAVGRDLAGRGRTTIIGLGIRDRRQRDIARVDLTRARAEGGDLVVVLVRTGQRGAGYVHLLVLADIAVNEGERAACDLHIVIANLADERADVTFGVRRSVIFTAGHGVVGSQVLLVDDARGGDVADRQVVVAPIVAVADRHRPDDAQQAVFAGILAVELLRAADRVTGDQASDLKCCVGGRLTIIGLAIACSRNHQVRLGDVGLERSNRIESVVVRIRASQDDVGDRHRLVIARIAVVEGEGARRAKLVASHQAGEGVERALSARGAVVDLTRHGDVRADLGLGDETLSVGDTGNLIVVTVVAVVQADHVDVQRTVLTGTLAGELLDGIQRVACNQAIHLHLLVGVHCTIIATLVGNRRERQRLLGDGSDAGRGGAGQDVIALRVAGQAEARQVHQLAGTRILVGQASADRALVEGHAIGSHQALRRTVAIGGNEAVLRQLVGTKCTAAVIHLGSRARGGHRNRAGIDLADVGLRIGAGQPVIGRIRTVQSHACDGDRLVLTLILRVERCGPSRNGHRVGADHAIQVGTRKGRRGGSVINLPNRPGELTSEILLVDVTGHVRLDDSIVVAAIAVVQRVAGDGQFVVARILAGIALAQTGDGVAADQARDADLLAGRQRGAGRAVIDLVLGDGGQRQGRLADAADAVGDVAQRVVAGTGPGQGRTRHGHGLAVADIPVGKRQDRTVAVDPNQVLFTRDDTHQRIAEHARGVNGAVIDPVIDRDRGADGLLLDRAGVAYGRDGVVVAEITVIDLIADDLQRLGTCILVGEGLDRVEAVAGLEVSGRHDAVGHQLTVIGLGVGASGQRQLSLGHVDQRVGAVVHQDIVAGAVVGQRIAGQGRGPAVARIAVGQHADDVLTVEPHALARHQRPGRGVARHQADAAHLGRSQRRGAVIGLGAGTGCRDVDLAGGDGADIRRHRRARQLVVYGIRAGQRHAGGGHQLVLAAILAVELGASDVDANRVALDDAHQVRTGQRSRIRPVILLGHAAQLPTQFLLSDSIGRARVSHDRNIVVLAFVTVVQRVVAVHDELTSPDILAVERLGQVGDGIAADQTIDHDHLIGAGRTVVGAAILNRGEDQVLGCDLADQARHRPGDDIVACVVASQRHAGHENGAIANILAVESAYHPGADLNLVAIKDAVKLDSDTRDGRRDVAVILLGDDAACGRGDLLGGDHTDTARQRAVHDIVACRSTRQREPAYRDGLAEARILVVIARAGGNNRNVVASNLVADHVV